MTSLNFFDNCPMARTVTVSNTSSVPLTWHMSGDLSSIVVNPLGSTLPVGGAVDVSVTPKVKFAQFDVSIDADIAPSQSLTILIQSSGYFITLPPDAHFGNVPLGTEAVAAIRAPLDSVPGLRLASSDPAFIVPDAGHTSTGIWNLKFHPTSLGNQQTTLTIFSTNGTVCPPNTFIADGVGVAP